MSNKAAVLAWTLISGDGSRPQVCEFTDQDVLQLKGIFMSLDHDKDGLLNQEQVVKAFHYVGINTSSDSINGYFLRENGLRAMEINFDTFVAALSTEKQSLKHVEDQLDTLFSFIDEKGTGTVSIQELEQLLTAETSPFRFSKPEFGAFVLSLDCSPSQRISTKLLKRKLLFGVEA